jgi:aryl-alcohol dehydrogenase-like predicted oxidoreductase
VDSLNARLKKLQNISQDLGMTLPQLGVAWCLKNKNVSSVILGASRPEQLSETLKAEALSIKLTPEIMTSIDAALENVPVPERIF